VLAAHLTNHVLPHLPVRQWVLSLPKRLRPCFHHNPDLAGAVLRILLSAICTTLRAASLGASPDCQLGTVSFPHRSGSSLDPHFHFHLVVLDGVHTRAARGIGVSGDARSDTDERIRITGGYMPYEG